MDTKIFTTDRQELPEGNALNESIAKLEETNPDGSMSLADAMAVAKETIKPYATVFYSKRSKLPSMLYSTQDAGEGHAVGQQLKYVEGITAYELSLLTLYEGLFYESMPQRNVNNNICLNVPNRSAEICINLLKNTQLPEEEMQKRIEIVIRVCGYFDGFLKRKVKSDEQ